MRRYRSSHRRPNGSGALWLLACTTALYGGAVVSPLIASTVAAQQFGGRSDSGMTDAAVGLSFIRSRFTIVNASPGARVRFEGTAQYQCATEDDGVPTAVEVDLEVHATASNWAVHCVPGTLTLASGENRSFYCDCTIPPGENGTVAFLVTVNGTWTDAQGSRHRVEPARATVEYSSGMDRSFLVTDGPNDIDVRESQGAHATGEDRAALGWGVTVITLIVILTFYLLNRSE